MHLTAVEKVLIKTLADEAKKIGAGYIRKYLGSGGNLAPEVEFVKKQISVRGVRIATIYSGQPFGNRSAAWLILTVCGLEVFIGGLETASGTSTQFLTDTHCPIKKEDEEEVLAIFTVNNREAEEAIAKAREFLSKPFK